MKEKTTHSEKETFDFACDLAKTLKGASVITLKGNLGAGKTVFSKGLAQGLGVKKTVTSPTFVVMKIYDVVGNKNGIEKLVHIDAYRLESGEDLKAIGADEYFSRDDCVTVIEWPEKIYESLPLEVVSFEIKTNNNTRKILKNF